MENVKIFEAKNLDGSIVEHIEITHIEGWKTIMPKSTYDEQQARPNVN
jgi:hypothetical protein